MTHSCVQYFLIFFGFLAEERIFLIVPSGGACVGATITFCTIFFSSMPLGGFSQPPSWKKGDVREDHIFFCLLAKDWFFLVVTDGGAYAEAVVIFDPISSSSMPLGSFSQPPSWESEDDDKIWFSWGVNDLPPKLDLFYDIHSRNLFGQGPKYHRETSFDVHRVSPLDYVDDGHI